MDWSIGNIIGIGMRIISNRNEVARVGQKVIAQIVQAEQLFGEVRVLIEKIAPELLVDLRIQDTRSGEVADVAPHAFDVTWVQQALNHLLHPAPQIRVDGIMGEQTRNAISLYQRQRELTVDGWLGPVTLASLDADIRDAHARTNR